MCASKRPFLCIFKFKSVSKTKRGQGIHSKDRPTGPFVSLQMFKAAKVLLAHVAVEAPSALVALLRTLRTTPCPNRLRRVLHIDVVVVKCRCSVIDGLLLFVDCRWPNA